MKKLPNFIILSSDFTVSPQIEPADIAEIIKLGYKTIINNRPDNEEAGQPLNVDLAAEAKKLGVNYYFLPVDGNLTEDMVYKSAEAILQAPQPVYAFCRSGARSTSMYQYSKQLISEQTLQGGEE